MKKILAIALAMIPLAARAQNDTIYLHSGKKVACEVTELSEKDAKYKHEGESLVNVISMERLDSIRLASGRVIVGAPRISVAGECGWQNVILTEGSYPVDGLVNKGEITVYGEQAATKPFSKYTDNREKAVSYAKEKLMQEAAFRGCHLAVIRRVEDVRFSTFEQNFMFKGKNGAAVNITATIYAYPED